MKHSSSAVPLSLILIIAVGTGLLDWFTPMMGDDLSKWIAMGASGDSFPDRQVLSFLAGHYFGCNGRVFDALGPLITNLLPSPLDSILMGVMCGLFFYLLCLSAKVFEYGRNTLACGLVTVALFTLPWWDSMFHRVCNFNYVWGTAFALLYVRTYFRYLDPGRYSWIWLFILGGVAGCFHEQISVAMVAYFGLDIIFRKRRDWHLVLFGGLCAGTLITVCTPNMWLRNAQFVADSPRSELLFNTLPLVIVLLAVLLIMLLKPSRRPSLTRMLAGEFGAYLAIALLTAAVALYSTIPGRTGWLPESFSLVCLTLLCEKSKTHLKRGVAGILIALCFVAVILHFGVSVFWQRKMQMEYAQAIELFNRSEDGVVRMDVTDRYDVPFLTLFRVKGLPDADDTHLQTVFDRYYGHGKKLLLLDDRSEVMKSMPAHTSRIYNMISDTLTVTPSSDGDWNVITPFEERGETFYRVSPFVRDPGDHWHKAD